MSYKHVATLTTASGPQLFTFTTPPLDGHIAIQCSGGDVRLAFGTSSTTASTTAGARVIADSPPENVDLMQGEDTVAIALDSNSAGPAIVEIMLAPRRQ